MLSPLVTQRWMDPVGAASAAQHAAVLAHLQHASPHSALSPNEDASNASMAHSSAHVSEQQRWHDSANSSAMQDTHLTQNETNALARQMVCSSTEQSCNSTVSSTSNDSNADASSVSSAQSVSPPAASAFTYVPAQDQRMEDVTTMQAAGKPFGHPLVPVASRAFTAVHPSAALGHAMGPMPIGSVPMGGVHYEYVGPAVTLGMGGYHHGQMASQGNHGGHNGQQQQQQQHSNDSSPAQPSRTAHHSPSMTPQTAPMSNSASAKRGQGFSCHHCKTHKMPELLLFCSNQSKKGPGKKRCRKKYCDSCLKRLYGHPADQPLQSVAAGFQCPACLGNCVCAGCERKTSGTGSATATTSTSDNNGASSSNGGGSSSAEESSNSEGSPTSQPQQSSQSHSSHGHRHSNSISSSSSAGGGSLGTIVLPASSGASPSKPAHMQQTKPTTPQGKPPVKKRRTSMDVGNVKSEMGSEESENGSAYSGAAAAAAAASASSGSTPAPLHPSVHVRSSSGEISIPSLFHAPQSSFNTGTTAGGMNTTASLLYSPCHSRGNSGGGPSNRIPSPRLAALTAVNNASAGSRMIHLPPFALSPSLLGGVTSAVSGHGSTTGSPSLAPLSFSYGASPFAPHIQQHVQSAVLQAAQQQQQQQHAVMEGGTSSDSQSQRSGSSILNSAAPSLSTQSIGGLLTVVSAPCSPYASSRHIPARRMSAFSPVQSGPEIAGAEEGQQSAAAMSTSMAGLTGPSPTVSPSLFHRSLQLNSPSHSAALPPKPTAAASAAAAAAAAASLSISPTGENELMMKVLANVACSATTTTMSSSLPASAVGAATGTVAFSNNSNSASLPPTHPVMSNREAASPKLSGFMASVSLLSPSHSSGMMLPPSASAASGLLGAPVGSASQSLAANVNLSVMQAQLKAQHQMEVQCLLLQQQQQLAELERYVAREVSDGQQMQQLQQQTTYWQQQQQQQTQMRGLNASSNASASSGSQPASPPNAKQESLRSDSNSAAVKTESEMKADSAIEEKKSVVSPSAATQSSVNNMQA